MGVHRPNRVRPTSLGINMFSPESAGLALRPLSGTQPASATYPVANLAILIIFRIYERVDLVKAMVYNGATASGHWDVGVYDSSGARLGSTGTQVQTGTSQTQEAALALSLAPGTYYKAISCDATTLTFMSTTVVAVAASLQGMSQAATAFVLPTNPTLAAFAQTVVPVFGLMRRSLAS